jgi:hypothetical protein
LIKSHTVPQSLLQRFAYYDPRTKSYRLWRYSKGRPPYNNQSPKSATRYAGHFSDPQDEAVEAELEQRLAREFEEPVNHFVHRLSEATFARTDEQREQLTRYVTLLFLRSRARRIGTKHLQEVKLYALNRFLENESQLLTVATNWNIDLICRGIRLSQPFTKDDVARRAREQVDFERTAIAEQKQYLVGLRRGMEVLDQSMHRGDWNLLTTTPDRPFIISDSPVVTWQRDAARTIHHGGGFEGANVEVLLPVSPMSCLHILPDVERTLPIVRPTAEEVNIGQAAFAYRDCFADRQSSAIDALVQQHVSTARIGSNVFTIWHRNYDNIFYEILMSGGRVEPPHR